MGRPDEQGRQVGLGAAVGLAPVEGGEVAGQRGLGHEADDGLSLIERASGPPARPAAGHRRPVGGHHDDDQRSGPGRRSRCGRGPAAPGRRRPDGRRRRGRARGPDPAGRGGPDGPMPEVPAVPTGRSRIRAQPSKPARTSSGMS